MSVSVCVLGRTKHHSFTLLNPFSCSVLNKICLNQSLLPTTNTAGEDKHHQFLTHQCSQFHHLYCLHQDMWSQYRRSMHCLYTMSPHCPHCCILRPLRPLGNCHSTQSSCHCNMKRYIVSLEAKGSNWLLF